MNYITDKLNKVLEDDKLLKWMRSNGILQAHQNIGDMNGPKCSEFLEKLPKLKQFLPQDLVHYIELFECFHEVRTSCFGNELYDDYDDKIGQFEEMWKEMQRTDGFTVPTKVNLLTATFNKT